MQRAGSFDFIPHVFRGLSRNELSWRISDHYPLWCEFLLPWRVKHLAGWAMTAPI
ncbi:hypothetical protein [Arthrobacter sp. ZGTC131]|uniref:hypothetical protein n=1 Tax=Arthrobacter sp. ZGTC131 TaxID=2058898 RepID=UPI0015E47808|nr:hypothetical protein [Arthrobacter sp. ZGTC131]